MRGRLFVVLLVLLLSAAPTAHTANSLATNPWMLDTASGTNIVAGNVRVSCVKWVGATTAGHQAVLQDNAGNVIWEDVAAGANYSTDQCEEDLVFTGGIKLVTLGSGRLYVYIAR